MSAATIEMPESAAAALGPLVDGDVVFVGGATIALWTTDQAASDFRPTDDVDVIVEVASRSEYYRFEDRLRELRERPSRRHLPQVRERWPAARRRRSASNGSSDLGSRRSSRAGRT